MARRAVLSITLLLVIVLLLPLSGAGLVRPIDRAAAPRPTLSAPTSYDILHDASPSTPKSAYIAPGANIVFGNFVRQALALNVPQRGFNIAFVRTYNSANPTSSPLGIGWTHPYKLTLTVESPLEDDPSGNLLRIIDVDNKVTAFSYPYSTTTQMIYDEPLVDYAHSRGTK